MVTEFEVERAGGVLHAYDSGSDASGPFTLVWHHGSPQTGAPLDPVLSAAAARGIRVVSYGRPSYGGSTARPGRDVASAAADVVAIADALGLDRLAMMGASGGGPHALAAAALAPGRVVGVVTLGSPAPFTERFDWFGGMAAPAALRSAREGRAARAAFAEHDEFDPEQFVAADYAALEGEWASLGADVARSEAFGPGGLVDDDVALAAPWGFELGDVRAPVLVVQGADDRVIPPAHGEWLARWIPGAELWLRPSDGHISVLDAMPEALDWLLAKPGVRG
ncbi:alpha/beta hydrolase [Agromyces neolithicus]|uniref:Alpha/beta hydrolase n=1 Tax=Agromyces neolithicus TaxID=269420 RepID=A0ABN2M0U4_9MICO